MAVFVCRLAPFELQKYNATNVSMGTLLSVLKALNAKAYLKVELPDNEIAISTYP